MGEIIDVSLLKNKKFYKFTNKKELHFGLKYHSGENVDPKEFDPSDRYSGMHFFEQSQLLKYEFYTIGNPYDKTWWIREVILLPESKVYKEAGKYKTDRFILKERKRFRFNEDLSDYITKEMCRKAIEKDAYLFEYIPPSFVDYKLCLEVITLDPLSLEFIDDEYLTEELCVKAVKGSEYALKYVPPSLMTIKMCFESLMLEGLCLEFIPVHLKTKEMCLVGVSRNGLALEYVPPSLMTEDLCRKAFLQNEDALEYVPIKIMKKILCMKPINH